jgi:hypothetical protein
MIVRRGRTRTRNITTAEIQNTEQNQYFFEETLTKTFNTPMKLNKKHVLKMCV